MAPQVLPLYEVHNSGAQELRRWGVDGVRCGLLAPLTRRDLHWSRVDNALYNEAFTGRAWAIPRCKHCLGENHASGDYVFAPVPSDAGARVREVRGGPQAGHSPVLPEEADGQLGTRLGSLQFVQQAGWQHVPLQSLLLPAMVPMMSWATPRVGVCSCSPSPNPAKRMPHRK